MDPTQFQMLQPEGDQRYAARQAHSPDPAAAGYAPYPAQSYGPAPSPIPAPGPGPAGYASPPMGTQYSNGPMYLGSDAGTLQSQTYSSVPAALQRSPPAMQQAFYHNHSDGQSFAFGPQQVAGAVSQGPSPSVSPTFPSFQLREGQQAYGPALSAGQAYGAVAGPSSDMQANAAYGHFADMALPYQLAPGPSLAKRQRGLEECMWEDDGEGNCDDGLQRGEEHKPKPCVFHSHLTAVGKLIGPQHRRVCPLQGTEGAFGSSRPKCAPDAFASCRSAASSSATRTHVSAVRLAGTSV